jgi:hypothetical protein
LSDLKLTRQNHRSNLIAGVFTVIPLVVWLVLISSLASFAVARGCAGVTMFITD